MPTFTTRPVVLLATRSVAVCGLVLLFFMCLVAGTSALAETIQPQEQRFAADPHTRKQQYAEFANPWVFAVQPSQMVHGGVGLIQIPTSRMMPESTLTGSYTDNGEYRFWSVNVQLFEWMQATVRYTDVRTRRYSSFESFSNDQTLKDKGIDAKFRLWQESSYLPEVAVGFRDFGGTGFFDSEFIGLSKRFGTLDTHLNLNWGYLGTHDDVTNPFCRLTDSYCDREVGFEGMGGKIDYQRFFTGPMGISAGLSWQTPHYPLTVNIEYEANNYVSDRAGSLTQDSRFNYELVYRWHNWDLSLNYQRGNTVGFGVSYNLDLNTASQPRFDRPPRDITRLKGAADNDSIERKRLVDDLYYQGGFALRTSHLEENKITLYGTQVAYRNPYEAAERVSRILASELPDAIDTYTIVEQSTGIGIVETEVNANDFKAIARHQTFNRSPRDAMRRQDVSEASITNFEATPFTGFVNGIETFWVSTFGSPEEFYMYQGGVMLNGGYVYRNKHRLLGTAKVTILENFDNFNFTIDGMASTVPRVRTFVREYVTRAPVTMENLYYQYVDRLAPNWYGQVYAGYLETMFGGLGGEVLYRPVDGKWSIGADLNYVRQRSFEDDVSFFDYSVLTGHVNVSYYPDFMDDARITLNMGRFLGKDLGVNVDFAKRFDSGIVVGAYAAFTNVSSEEYGEGSFTKGFYLNIPLDLLTLQPAKGSGKFPWIPIGRDGGQMLNRPQKLDDFTQGRHTFY